jgi:hypothetical protein
LIHFYKRVTLIGSRVIEPMSSVKMISSSSLLTILLLISSFSLHFVVSLPTTSDEYEYPNDAGEEYEYDADERSEEKYVAKELDVKITSEKKHVIVAEEGLIRLQCLVENNDNIPIIWSHVQESGTSQIAIGDKKINERVSVSVDNSGSTLLIPQAKVSDAGEYLCQVATGQDPIPSLVHTVSVRQQGEVGSEATQASTLKSNASSSTFSLLLFLLLPLLLIRP